jgi:hypothetical protein
MVPETRQVFPTADTRCQQSREFEVRPDTRSVAGTNHKSVAVDFECSVVLVRFNRGPEDDSMESKHVAWK